MIPEVAPASLAAVAAVAARRHRFVKAQGGCDDDIDHGVEDCRGYDGRMLTRIGTPTLPSSAAQETAVAFLLACHDRLRRFTAIAADLARTNEPVPADEVRESARAVARFFQVAAPLHVLDEEQSLLPRLRPAAPAQLLGALRLMHDEHPAIEATVCRLVDLCAEIGADPRRLPSRRQELGEAARALAGHWEGHLPPEEGIIFPAVNQLLSGAEQDAMLSEMRARRVAAR